MSEEIYIIPIEAFAGTTIAASATSDAFDLDFGIFRPDGFASLQIAITGTGTAKIYYTSSNDGLTYVVGDDAVDIITAMTVGEKFLSIEPIFSKYIKIYVEETGGANAITITKAILAIQ